MGEVDRGDFNPVDQAITKVDAIFLGREPSFDWEQISIADLYGPEHAGPTLHDGFHSMEWTNKEGEQCKLNRRRHKNPQGDLVTTHVLLTVKDTEGFQRRFLFSPFMGRNPLQVELSHPISEGPPPQSTEEWHQNLGQKVHDVLEMPQSVTTPDEWESFSTYLDQAEDNNREPETG